ncbi:MAG TPA: V4R domain-containing protein [Thermoplasmata archaeon]|jgi:predicted hydrocarbon binding protein|nr:V4R domain-containing protein [Thermoplasmata archaeon]
MTNGTKDVFARMKDEMKMEADGILTLHGDRTVILPAKLLTDIEAQGERVIGKAVGSIFYRAGEEGGKDVAKIFLGLPFVKDPIDALPYIMAEGVARGFGRMELLSHDPAAGTASLRVFDSSSVARRDKRVATACYFHAGFWAGVLTGLDGKHIAIEERTCAVQGGPYCEFVAHPA